MSAPAAPETRSLLHYLINFALGCFVLALVFTAIAVFAHLRRRARSRRAGKASRFSNASRAPTRGYVPLQSISSSPMDEEKQALMQSSDDPQDDLNPSSSSTIGIDDVARQAIRDDAARLRGEGASGSGVVLDDATLDRLARRVARLVNDQHPPIQPPIEAEGDAPPVYEHVQNSSR